jgi:2-octaprenyl-6-methoxyphenol hydroxylase
MHQISTCEVAVIGGGPAGLVAALAVAATGADTLLIAPKPAATDHRTTALLASSVKALDMLGAWPACLAQSAPLRKLRIIDDTQRLFRAPEVFFDAAEIGLEAFGHNIENRHLVAALEAGADEIKLPRITTPALAITPRSDLVTIKHSGGEVRVRLVIGADGAQSLCRAAAGITTRRRTYPQSAVTLNLGHSRSHDDTSTEFHTESGPFTLVPLPGLRSSLVWVLAPERAAALRAYDDVTLAAEIERHAHSLLGEMQVELGRGLFPLMVETAASFASRRTVLVGEAAHIVPPIGAQGLNLGLRDAATIAEIVADARRDGRDPGSPDVLARYERQRRADVTSRSIAVDLLNRSLLTDFVPAHGARGLSLYLLDRIGPLRRAMMREGVVPVASQPRLMRGETA